MLRIKEPLDEEGNSLLHIAARGNEEEVVLQLLQQGFNVNQRNLLRNTPVHEAVLHGRTLILKHLFENGGDINLTGADGLLPLQQVALSNHDSLMEAVLDCRPEINKKNEHGYTALLFYIDDHHHRMSDIISLLVSGSDPNIPNNAGWNCLHFIASDWEMSKTTLTRMLILYGADVNAEIPDGGYTALQLAYSQFKCDVFMHILLQNDAIIPLDWGTTALFESISGRNLRKLFAHMIKRDLRFRFLRDASHLTYPLANGGGMRIMLDCSREWRTLQYEKINGQSITYHQFLQTSVEECCRLSYDKNFCMEIFQKIKSFPNYSDFLLDHLYAGLSLRRAKRDAALFLGACLELPALCCDKIVSYLNTDELLFLHKHLQIY